MRLRLQSALRNQHVRIGVAVAILVSMGWVLALELSQPNDIALRANTSQAVYDKKGTLLRLSLSSDEHYRLPVALETIAPAALEAVLLHEDQNFYEHNGVDWLALGRAAVQTYVLGARRQGASTITMQLARMRYGIDSRSIGGKLKQMWSALCIDYHYTKGQILEAYFALLPYGSNIQGIEAASLLYFDKRAKDLNQREAFALAVIPQSPTRRTPKTAAGRARLFSAANRLLKRAGLHLSATLVFGNVSRARPQIAPHFADAILAQPPNRSGSDAHIQTTIDTEKTLLLTQILQAYVTRSKERAIDNAAALLVDTRTNEVLVEVGSASYFDHSIDGQVNGTRAKRSPGSTIKPFIYALALSDGLIHPHSLLADAPRRFAAFNPENYDRDFRGPMNATEALMRSRNIPAVALLHQLGLPRLHKLLVDGGVTGLREPDHYGLTLALGGAEITMHELVRLYAALLRSGEADPLVVRQDQGTIAASTPTLPLVHPGAALLTLRMLASHPRPGQVFSDAWTAQKVPVAWKTGTSQGFRDAWTVGVFGHYALAVWVGRFDGEGRPSFLGAQAAAPLFFEMVDALKENAGTFEPNALPADIVDVEVCGISGQIPNDYCPHKKKVSFLAGISPITRCKIHRHIAIRQASGLRACAGTEHQVGVRSVVVEQWPSDLADLYDRAGIPRRSPPAYEKDCSTLDKSGEGISPKIISPLDGTEIRVSALGKTAAPLLLRAMTGTDSTHHDWFADNRYVGRTQRGNTLVWEPSMGRTQIRVVDDRGRSDLVVVRVGTLE